MKKRYFALLSLGLALAFCMTGCGKKAEEPVKEEKQEEDLPELKVDEEGNLILSETAEESGEVGEENTEEETGEVVDQVEVDFDASIDEESKKLTIETTNGGITDGTWKYLATEESVISLESEEDLENGGKRYVFTPAEFGESVIGISFFEAGEEGDITPEDVKEGLTDVSVTVSYREEENNRGEKVLVFDIQQ